MPSLTKVVLHARKVDRLISDLLDVVEVGEIHLGNEIVVAKELPNGAKPFHCEVFVLDVLVGLAEIHTSPHLAGTFLRYGKKVD